jgi:signal transduction histidine kinase
MGAPVDGLPQVADQRLAWVTWLTAMLLTTGGLVFLWLNRSTPDSGAGFLAGEAVFAVACATVGGLVTTRRPDNPIGWLYAAGALLTATGMVASGWATYSLSTSPGALPGGEAAVFGVLLLLPGLILPLVFATLLFPHGRLPSPRWWPAVWLAAAGLLLALAATALAPGPIPEYDVERNPLGIEGAADVLDPLRALGFLLISAAGAAAIASLVLRLRRGSAEERQQLKWIAFAVALAALTATAAELLPFDLAALQLVAVPLVPAAVGVAILRYRLWDIDPILNRSLVYAGLTACVVGLYVGVVTLLGALFARRADLVASLLATGLVAVLFQPLRQRLQRAVNRLMYGERDDPYAVISRVGRRLEEVAAPEAVLPAVAETVARALRLSSVAIELRAGGGFEPVATVGTPAGRPESLELSYQGESVGRIVVGPRAAGEELSAADRRLLADLARQAAVAAHAVRLTADLQRSRERLVSAQEEERRRLRRDLHDGLGPTLAGVSMQLGGLRGAVSDDPGGAVLLTRLEQEIQGAIADIRRLVYDLRPPALDELGLVRAVEERAASFRGAGLEVVLEGDPEPDEIPAAVEVAMLRIVHEALANVARHARAERCVVRLSFGDVATVEVHDDGRGVPAGFRAGVGVSSMRERAAELGGTLEIAALPGGGTRVTARLPLRSP